MSEAAAPDPIKVDHVTTLEAFDACADEWDAAVSRSLSAGVQGRHFWIRRWLTTIGSGQSLAFRVMRDSAGIVGCAAWIPTVQQIGFARVPILRLAGQPMFKRTHVTLVRRHSQAVTAMLQDLRKLRWWWLDPGLLTDEDPLLAAIPQPGSTVRHYERCSYRLPVVSAARRWEDYFAGLPRTIKKQHRRRGASSELTVRTFPSGFASVDSLIAAIEHVARRSWSFDEGTSIISTDPQWQFWQGIIRDAAAQGILHASCLFDVGRPVAFSIGILQNRILYGLKTSFDRTDSKIGPGQAVYLSFIQSGMADPRVETIDLDCIIGRGDYKLDWATDIQTVRQYYAFRCSPVPSLFMHAYRLKKHFASTRHGVLADLEDAAT